jgi:hypothetical protein
MGLEHDSWLEGLGVALPNSGDDDTSDDGVATASAKAAETSAAASGDVSTDSGESATRPTIAVAANGDGSFTITGSDFLKSATVHIRMVDEALHQLWMNTTSDGQGQITASTGGICAGARQVSFSANDGRQVPSSQDITGVLWSNTVTVACPQPSAPDDPDDPDDPPTDPPAPSDPGSGESGESGSGDN